MDSVVVTAADFNGETFDGFPFSANPPWLGEAVGEGRITIKLDDRDYALWSVTTPGGIVVAEPDDVITHAEDGTLTVRKAA